MSEGDELRPRARDLGLPFRGTPGPFNALTDVPGVAVGSCTLHKPHPHLEVGVGPINTGVTAVLPRGRERLPQPVWGANFAFNGNGEMTGSHWLNDAGYFIGPVCLTNTHSVGMVHHAATRWMIEQYPSVFQEHHAWAMPVVAETYDGATNDICGQHVQEAHALQAINSAQSGPVAEGNVGGGTGMQTYGFKGGTGTSSRVVDLAGQGFTVAALVQSNFGARPDLQILGVPVGELMSETQDPFAAPEPAPEMGSIIVLIGTDAPLTSAQLHRLAKRGAMGIARTGTPGGHYSGDIMLAFSVANPITMPPLGSEQPLLFSTQTLNDAHCDPLFLGAVQAVEEAIINAMVAAESMPLIKPAGGTLHAIDHQALQQLFATQTQP